jgi:hypothetical protein
MKAECVRDFGMELECSSAMPQHQRSRDTYTHYSTPFYNSTHLNNT